MHQNRWRLELHPRLYWEASSASQISWFGLRTIPLGGWNGSGVKGKGGVQNDICPRVPVPFRRHRFCPWSLYQWLYPYTVPCWELCIETPVIGSRFACSPFPITSAVYAAIFVYILVYTSLGGCFHGRSHAEMPLCFIIGTVSTTADTVEMLQAQHRGGYRDTAAVSERSFLLRRKRKHDKPKPRRSFINIGADQSRPTDIVTWPN